MIRIGGIGKYSAKKFYFFPSRRKNFPIFSLSEVENFVKIALFWDKLPRLAFLGENYKNVQI